MHGSDTVKADLPGYLCETSLNIELAHQLFAVVEILKIHFQFVQEQLLRFGHSRVHHVL